MSKVSAPLLSFGASGQVGKSVVFGTWKGVSYARRHVIPANPRSTEQTLTRNVFSWLNNVYKIAPSEFTAAWRAAVKGRALTDRNLFMQQNIPILRDMPDLTGMVFSPGAKGGLPASVTITPGNDQVTIAAPAPDPLPSGWTVVRFIAAAIRQQEPGVGAFYEIVADDDPTAAYSVTLTGLADAADYMGAGWFEFQKSALATDLAYGPAVGEEFTTT